VEDVGVPGHCTRRDDGIHPVRAIEGAHFHAPERPSYRRGEEGVGEEKKNGNRRRLHLEGQILKTVKLGCDAGK
jgi:hypothetical protein